MAYSPLVLPPFQLTSEPRPSRENPTTASSSTTNPAVMNPSPSSPGSSKATETQSVKQGNDLYPNANDQGFNWIDEKDHQVSPTPSPKFFFFNNTLNKHASGTTDSPNLYKNVLHNKFAQYQGGNSDAAAFSFAPPTDASLGSNAPPVGGELPASPRDLMMDSPSNKRKIETLFNRGAIVQHDSTSNDDENDNAPDEFASNPYAPNFTTITNRALNPPLPPMVPRNIPNNLNINSNNNNNNNNTINDQTIQNKGQEPQSVNPSDSGHWATSFIPTAGNVVANPLADLSALNPGNQQITRELVSTTSFAIVEQPTKVQRKCYRKENRYLNPNPIILSQLDENGSPIYDPQSSNPSKVLVNNPLQGLVTVSLVDNEGKDVPNAIECPHAGLTRSLDNGVTFWAVKALQNSGPNRKFRLKFIIVYVRYNNGQKTLCEEHLFSEEFGVYSNKNNRAHKIPGLILPIDKSNSPKRSRKSGKTSISNSPMLSDSSPYLSPPEDNDFSPAMEHMSPLPDIVRRAQALISSSHQHQPHPQQHYHQQSPHFAQHPQHLQYQHPIQHQPQYQQQYLPPHMSPAATHSPHMAVSPVQLQPHPRFGYSMPPSLLGQVQELNAQLNQPRNPNSIPHRM